MPSAEELSPPLPPDALLSSSEHGVPLLSPPLPPDTLLSSSERGVPLLSPPLPPDALLSSGERGVPLLSPPLPPETLRIRSSGEPGVPLAALNFAAAHSIPYEGWCVRLPLPSPQQEPSALLSSHPLPSSLLSSPHPPSSLLSSTQPPSSLHSSPQPHSSLHSSPQPPSSLHSSPQTPSSLLSSPHPPSSLLCSQLREVPTPSTLLATAWNVRDAHATVLFTLSPSLPASPLACRRLCSRHASPLLHLCAASAPLAYHAASLRAFLARHAVRVLHVDGSRASEELAAAAFAEAVLAATLALRDERRAKRRRGEPPRQAAEDTPQPPPLVALLALLPPPHRRLREPDPSLLFFPHHVPAAHASHVRVCTFNLLDDCGVHGGAHAVWELRRVNVLRVMLAIDADAYLLQEVNERSAAFLRATLGHEYTLELRGGVGVMYRHAAGRRALHFFPAAPPEVRRLPSPPSARRRRLCGECLHLPLRAHGLAAAPQSSLILSSVHLFLKGPTGQLLAANSEAHHFSSHLGRDLLRLPSLHGGAPMLLGGDFNPGRTAKQPRVGGRLSLHAALTERFRRPPDSDDEWDEDAEQAVAWPPPHDCRLAVDVWRDDTVEERLYGGLQRGSTCLQRAMQSHLGKYQGVVARGVNEGWSPAGESTDEGHIDWILRSDAPSVGGRRLQACRVAVCTEQLCPPLPPQDECLGIVPAGGSFFPSDHYPVFADLKVCSD